MTSNKRRILESVVISTRNIVVPVGPRYMERRSSDQGVHRRRLRTPPGDWPADLLVCRTPSKVRGRTVRLETSNYQLPRPPAPLGEWRHALPTHGRHASADEVVGQSGAHQPRRVSEELSGGPVFEPSLFFEVPDGPVLDKVGHFALQRVDTRYGTLHGSI